MRQCISEKNEAQWRYVAADMSNNRSDISLPFILFILPSSRLFIFFLLFYFLPFYPSILSFLPPFSFPFFVASKTPPWCGRCGAISYVVADDICTELYPPIEIGLLYDAR